MARNPVGHTHKVLDGDGIRWNFGRGRGILRLRLRSPGFGLTLEFPGLALKSRRGLTLLLVTARLLGRQVDCVSAFFGRGS